MIKLYSKINCGLRPYVNCLSIHPVGRLVLSLYTCIGMVQANENGPDLDREISRDFNKICNIFKKYLIISLQVCLK